jgi:Pentapeptide repeats (9 copies)/Pentapeptide repeats (8 copies)
MPYVFKEPHRPHPWPQYRYRVRSRLLRPFLYIEWLSEWAAWFLGRWVFLEVLEYCGTLSILIGVIFYFAGSHDRREQKHFQAWQVIDSAQGKGGSGGRIDALQDLNADNVDLVGVDLSDAFLHNLQIPGARLARSNLSGADMRGANLKNAIAPLSTLIYTNLRNADLRNAQFAQSDFTNADFNGATLAGADFTACILDKADLRNTDLSNLSNWKSIQSILMANIQACRNPPDGFVPWALAHGAVQIDSDNDWQSRIAATQPAR